jgi:hypothetical protein
VAYNFQTGNNKIKLLTEYEDVTQKVLFDNAVLAALMSGHLGIFLGAGLGVMDQFRGLRAHPILRRLISSWGGYVKDTVYKTPVTSLDELKLRIVAAILTVTLQMLENTWREIEYRLDVLRAMKGAHVEVV